MNNCILNATSLYVLVLLTFSFLPACASATKGNEPPQYPDAISDFKPPKEPVHRTWFVDTPLPDEGNQKYRDMLNGIVGRCIRSAEKGDEKGLWAKFRCSQYFGLYAVWGLCSPDSRHNESKVLEQLLRAWMDETYPQESGELKSGWKAWYLYAPLVEISARPGLRKLVGEGLLNRGIRRVLENARRITEEKWEKILRQSVKIVNFPTHGQMFAFTLGWILAREHEPQLAPQLLRRAAYLTRMLEWHMQPNGTIRYIYEPEFDGPQLVGEQMYYHNVNIRALYMYWWFVGDERAEILLHAQAPYYKLRVMPWVGRGGAPHGTHYHSAIWWKEQWRTFWPGAVALSAASTEDGQLAKLALEMAQNNTGHDRKFADWAVHGYKQLALREVKPQPRADNYVLPDPDIGGLRMKFGHLSSVFSSNSYGYTLAGSLTPQSGLAGAYPMVRIDPLVHNPKYQFSNYHIAGLKKPLSMIDVHEKSAAAAGSYVPHDQKTTWRNPHRSGPWQVRQAWLFLPDQLVGLMTLRTTGEARARNAEHIFRLMTGKVSRTEDDTFEAGELKLQVGPTNLPHLLVEPARKYSMSTGEPWQQVVLSHRKRPSKKEAREGGEDEEPTLPLNDYEPDQCFHSVVEIRRSDAAPARLSLISSGQDLLAFEAGSGPNRYLTVANFAGGDGPGIIAWKGKELSIPPKTVKLIRNPEK
ncbi:MAG: hypothetical protein ACLFWL_09755 [Candidatus Brocadiia bacterium]